MNIRSIVQNIICFQTQKKLNTLNNIRALLKRVLFEPFPLWLKVKPPTIYCKEKKSICWTGIRLALVLLKIWTCTTGYLWSQEIIYDSPGKKHQYSLSCSLPQLMFNNFPKLTKTLYLDKRKFNALFHLSRSMASIKTFSCHKKLRQFKNYFEINL